jgi:hypothetical protein
MKTIVATTLALSLSASAIFADDNVNDGSSLTQGQSNNTTEIIDDDSYFNNIQNYINRGCPQALIQAQDPTAVSQCTDHLSIATLSITKGMRDHILQTRGGALGDAVIAGITTSDFAMNCQNAMNRVSGQSFRSLQSHFRASMSAITSCYGTIARMEENTDLSFQPRALDYIASVTECLKNGDCGPRP